jgi:hypothetical protein
VPELCGVNNRIAHRGNLREVCCERSVNSKEPLIKFECDAGIPSGAKARPHFVALTARLKSCPFKASTYSEIP